MCLLITLFTLLLTILEVKLLGVVSTEFGNGNMWLLIMGTAFIGWILLKEQKQLSQKMQQQMMQGQISDPSQMMRPLLTLFSAILLMIPGALTDILGLAMLHPTIGQLVLQKLLRGGLQAVFKNAQQNGGMGGFGGFGGMGNMGGFGGENTQTPGSHPFEAMFRQHQQSQQGQPTSEPAEPILKEGIHPTQKPSSLHARKRAGKKRTSQQVDPKQVIIDVDAEIVD